MAGEIPSKNDINAIFKRLRSIPTNKQCFDCGATNPTWASVTYGVFLCIDCSAVHRSLGVHLTFIRSTQLDTSWTWLQLRAMQVGGNASATGFFRQHGCTSTDAQQKYHSRSAQMYREKLHSLALKTMKQSGTKLHIDHPHAGPTSPLPKDKDVDFFKEHETISLKSPEESNIPSTGSMNLSEPVPISNGSLSSSSKPVEDPTQGPNVEAALSMSPTEAQQIAEPRKATIGARKPAGAKKGLGGKKGLGAQKVKANFSDIENAAQQRDKDKVELEANLAAQKARTKEEEEKKMASMRLAYKDLSMEEKRRDEKMKHMDPKKAQQMERLGMGMGSGGGGASNVKSHSAFSDMKTIEQEKVQNDSYDRYSSRNRQRDYDDDFEFIGGGFSSGPPKYDDSPFGLKKEDRYSSNFGSSSSKKSSWDADDRFDTKQSSFKDETSTSSINRERDDDRGRSRKTSYETSSSEEAQKKFGNAKAISSDAYFGKYDADFETRQNLSKFEGSSSISSAQLFGREETTKSRSSNYDDYGSGPDLQEIKDQMKHSVATVAGKLSKLTNGVINSLQDYSG